MTDVFISYSRLDRDFVGKLREALLTQAQEVWIDWESIPPSQAWWNEIQKGIARANNFVVVLSPASMASPICQMEIEYARQLHKRIIPVLHADYDRTSSITSMAERLAKKEESNTREIWGSRQPHDVYDSNDAELKHINYFFFKADADFAARFTDLYEIIRTDYRHKEQHTTLELRAQEWDRRGRDSSFLLIENELREAQNWLVASVGKEPPPTELHHAYIDASAKRTRQLRNIRRASIIGSLVALLAILFALGSTFIGARAVGDANDQLNTATIQQGLAQAQANEAGTRVIQANLELTSVVNAVGTEVQQGANQIESLRLAAAAVNILNLPNANVETAALLGIRALRANTSPEAVDALEAALDKDYLLQVFTLDQSGNPVNAVAYSPDGRTILAGGGPTFILDPLAPADYAVRLWNTDTGVPLQQLTGHEEAVTGVNFAPDGKTILTSSLDGSLRLWDSVSGQEIDRLDILPQQSGLEQSIAFSPDGQFILTGSRDGIVHLWNARTGTFIREYNRVGTGSIVSLAFSPDGNLFVSGNNFGVARLWNVEDGQQIHEIQASTSSIQVAYLAEGRGPQAVVTGDNQGYITLWRWELPGADSLLLSGHTNRVTKLAVSPNLFYVLSASSDGTIRLWDAFTATEVRRFAGQFTSVTSVAFSPDGNAVLAGYADGSIRRWDANVDSNPRHLVAEGIIISADYNPDGSRLLTRTNNNLAIIWDTETGRWLDTLPFSVVSASYSPDGYTIVTVAIDGSIRLWDTGTRTILRQIRFTTPVFIYSAIFSPDGRFILASAGSQITIWEVSTGELKQEWLTDSNTIAGASFSPDGQFVLYTQNQGPAILRSFESGEVIHRFGDDDNALVSGGIVNAIFSPDGRIVLTERYQLFVPFDSTPIPDSPDKPPSIQLWDAATGSEIPAPAELANFDRIRLFDPGGRNLLLFDNTSSRLVLWNMDTRAERVVTDTGFVSRIPFSPDGRFLAAMSSSGSVRIYNTDYADLIAYACSKMVQDLTDSERSTWQVDSSATCPQFADSKHPPPVPVPPAHTPLPIPTLPVWTPIASPTISLTLTLTPSFTPTPLYNFAGVATVGENRGEVTPGNVQYWYFDGYAGDVITIQVIADQPGSGTDPNTWVASGKFDSRLTFRAPNGNLLAFNDDRDSTLTTSGGVADTNSEVANVPLSETGAYAIYIESAWVGTSGAYTLVIERVRSGPTPTPSPTLGPTPTLTWTPNPSPTS